MLGNTLVLPLSTGNVTLIKINQDNYSSVYRFNDATHEYRVTIRHSRVAAKAGRAAHDRHNVELVETIYATDTVPEDYRKFYFVDESAPSDTSVVNADGLADLMIASSNAFLVSLKNWES